MIASTFSVILVAFGTGATAQALARLVPQELAGRTSRPVGGFAVLATVDSFCPNDLVDCGSSTMCCPNGLTCAGAQGQQIASRCCPGTEDCYPPLRASPFCADDSWSLWDATHGGVYPDGYFCCLPGAVGLLDGTCIKEETLVSPTLEALALAPGGKVISTSTSVASTTIATSVASSTIVVHSTTTSSPVVTSTGTLASNSAAVGTAKTGSVLSGGSTTSAKASSTSSSVVAASTTAQSDGNSYKNIGFGYAGLAEAALGIFVAAVL